MELGKLMKANFQYTQLVERKAELSLELSRVELMMHVRYHRGHTQYDPDCGVSGETPRQEHSRLQEEYDSVCAWIGQLMQDMRRAGYELTPLETRASAAAQ